MQGTIVMLMAMSGLGCHHKHRDVAPVSACYSSAYDSGCYSSYAPVATTYVVPSGYSACYSSGYSSCYSSGYSGASFSSCYGGSGSGGGCYGGKHHGMKKMFGGLFGHKKRRHAEVCCEVGGVMPRRLRQLHARILRTPMARASPTAVRLGPVLRHVWLGAISRHVRLGAVDGLGAVDELWAVDVVTGNGPDGSPAARHLGRLHVEAPATQDARGPTETPATPDALVTPTPRPHRRPPPPRTPAPR
ncbi:MAG: hypothetical protein WKF75_14750 [Singulisphaera sp.]